MNDFFWASGHLGWGIFAVVVFTGLWWILADLYWRLKRTRIGRLLMMLATGWIVAVGLILLAFYVVNR